MRLLSIWDLAINSGVNPGQTHTFSDKLITRNKLAFFCSVFSLIYVVFFLHNSLYVPLMGIIFGILLFVLSIVLNKYRQFTFSSILILLNTNYCVLFFSTYLGFDSGIHLYLFTSPFIVLTAFDSKNIKLISLAMASYLVNFIIISVTGKYFDTRFIELSELAEHIFYITNFLCSLFILVTLSLYFLYNNNKINNLLTSKNDQLSQQQRQLFLENRIRKEAESKAKESLAQKEVLLSEIHHRVKNNLAVVSGLLELQGAHTGNEKNRNAIKESQNRIKSMAILHEKLYENKTLKDVEIRSYIDELIQFVKTSLFQKEKAITITTRIDQINLEMTKAMPFALLINELISNSYKHAFKHKNTGHIIIKFSGNQNGYLLNYMDDGIGFKYFDGIKRDSFGLTLIETFSEQLKGNFKFLNRESGMEFTLNFA